MKNYFLELESEDLVKLDTADIPYAPADLGFGPGVIVDSEKFEQARIILEGEVTTTMNTPIDGLIKVIMRFTRKEGDAVEKYVTVASWDGQGRDRFVEIAREFSKRIGRKVVIHVPHNHISTPIDDESFHIFVWSAPLGGNTGNATPHSLFGIDVSCRDSDFRPSGSGVVITDETDHPVGEIIGEKNLYIFHDLVHYGNDSEFKLFRHILEETERAMKPLTKEERKLRDERLQKIAAEKRKRTREQYIQQCAGRLDRDVNQTKNAIAEAHDRIEKYQHELVENIRRASESERRLEFLTVHRKDAESEFGIEFDKLLEVPKVIDVQIDERKVIIFTDTLTCVDPRSKKRHEIGKFRIELRAGGDDGIVKMLNLTRQVVGYEGRKMHAPHVFPEGKPCLGNIKEVLPELIAQYQFSAAAMVAINYLESVNVDDNAGIYIDRWPLAK